MSGIFPQALAARQGDMFALYDCASQGLNLAPDDEHLRYLQSLALARLCEPAAALALYQRNRVAQIGTEDALALKGRILKDMAVLADKPAQRTLFAQASEAYKVANAIGDGYFSAINAATTAFLAGDGQAAVALAAAIAARPEIARPADYYAAATAAEAMLLRRQIDTAAAQLEQACSLAGASLGARASTIRQFGLIADHLGLGESDRARLLRPIRIPPVLHYCGHMFVDGWQAETGLAAAIAADLDETGAIVAYGALACGADILVAEALLDRGAEVNIVLPFEEEDFIAASVTPGGQRWVDRYKAVRQRAASFTLATQMRFIGDDNQFSYCSQLAMGLARLRARVMQADAVQLALSDGAPPGGTAGTAVNIAEWGRQGGRTRIIAVAADRPRLPLPSAVVGYAGPKRKVHAILFADFSGFSKLTELELPDFLDSVMGRISTILDRYGDRVLSCNTWGDAVHAVIDVPETAAAIALEIQAQLGGEHLAAIGLPEDGGMRISLHLGPIYESFDPIRKERTFFGTEVTLAARIEPRVPVGSIYVTQPFAAMIDKNAAAGLSFEYVGNLKLAKNYGSRVIYRLIKSEVSSVPED